MSNTLIDSSKIPANANRFWSSKIKLSKNIDINDYNFKTMKKLNENSFSFSIVYDLSDCYYIKYYKKKLLLELNELFPDYNAFIKIKCATYTNHSEKKFNTVQFIMDKVESNNENRIWASVVLSYDEKHAEELRLTKIEELE